MAAEPIYLDVSVPPGVRKGFAVDTRRNAFAYVFEGSGNFRDASAPFGVLTDRPGPVENVVREQTGDRSLVMFDSGDEVVVQAGEKGIRFLLVAGRPIQEPVAWYGPIVMNTAMRAARIREIRKGTLIQYIGTAPELRARPSWGPESRRSARMSCRQDNGESMAQHAKVRAGRARGPLSARHHPAAARSPSS